MNSNDESFAQNDHADLANRLIAFDSRIRMLMINFYGQLLVSRYNRVL